MPGCVPAAPLLFLCGIWEWRSCGGVRPAGHANERNDAIPAAMTGMGTPMSGMTPMRYAAGPQRDAGGVG